MVRMLELLARRWWMVVLRGAFAVLFGLLAIIWPDITVLALVLLWGAYALIDGLTSVMLALSERTAAREDRLTFGLLGVLGIAAGVVTFVWPTITAMVLLLVIAFWAILAGVLQIAAAIRLRKVITNEWFLGLTGAVCIVLGILLVVQPTEGAIGLVIAIATFAIVWGVTLILFGLRMRTIAHARVTMGE